MSNPIRILAAIALSAVPLAPVAAAATDAPSAEITITRLSEDAWQVDYVFRPAIDTLALGPPVVEYRARAWDVLSPGLALVGRETEERLVSGTGPFDAASIRVSRYSRYPHDNYVPIAPFSDGGAAVYLGFFLGDAFLGGERAPVSAEFRLIGLPEERAILGEAMREGRPGFAYFGPWDPAPAGDARILLDPATPAWLRDTFERVTDGVTRIYRERLPADPPSPPLFLVAAGDLEAIEGYSTKGGAVNGQVMFWLQGKELLEESPAMRSMLEKLTAHELAHLWQEVGLEGGYNMEQPWIHEGAAEAMAVAALEQSGLWSEEQAHEFTESAERRCRSALGDSDLASQVAEGNWGGVYPCGYLRFQGRSLGVFDLWPALLGEADRRNGRYTQEVLDAVLERSPE